MSKSETETKEERRARKALKKEKKEKKRDRDEPTEATSPITSIESEAEPSAKKLKAEDGSAKTTKVSGNPSVDKFSICDETKASLRKRGIEELFPIQALTFDKIMEGKDIMGRARTGMGKTLAFALPVIEMLLKNKTSQIRGRAPRVVCMAPTRELAKQVAAEFESTAPSLATVCIYGGASYRTQNDAFRAGVDVLVGTTGRVIDHIDRGNLRLHNCEFLILDEADTMLEMGFREDVQKVFAAMQEVQQADGKKQQQTLLFSATIPSWITQVANTYMQKDYEYVNLVGDMDDQASTDVQHLAIPCHWQGKASMLANLLNLYGTRQSRSIIFAETKKDCNELSVHPEIKQECQVLHGDIAQDQRETTMKAFRDGKLRLLIATDVAARGLDMNVDLVVNSEPPRKFGGNADVDTYVHRSGRTGRAGRKGVCITLYTPRQLDLLKQIEHKIGNKFVMRGPPSQEEMLKASAAKAWKEIENVDENMTKIFEDKAEEIIESMGAKKCVASALAVITGHTKPPRRTSLMSGAPDYVTVQFLSYNPIRAKGYVWNAVNREFPEDLANDIQQMTIAEDQMSACFDLPEKGLEKLNQLMEEQGEECIFTIPKELPKLQAQKFAGGGRGGGRGGRGGRGGSRGGRFGQSGRGGGRGGRGRRF